MKRRIFVFAMVLFMLGFFSAYAEGMFDTGSSSSSSSGWGETSISSAPKIIKSKNIEVPDRHGHFNEIGLMNQYVMIRVELCEATGGNNAGERYTFMTVTGLRVDGGRIETLSGSKLNEYQASYGGRRSQYEYDDIR
jgi:hypothetical protein